MMRLFTELWTGLRNPRRIVRQSSVARAGSCYYWQASMHKRESGYQGQVRPKTMREGLPDRCCHHRQKNTNITQAIGWLGRGDLEGSKYSGLTLLLLSDVLPFLPIFQTQLETRNQGSSGGAVCIGHFRRALQGRQEMDLGGHMETINQNGLILAFNVVKSEKLAIFFALILM